MEIKKLFKNYKNNKALVVLCDREIAIRRMDLMPSMVNTLSLAPAFGNGTGSTVENTVEKFDGDRDIQYWQCRKQQAILDNQTVDSILGLMAPDMRQIFELRYIDGKKASEIAEMMGYCERDVYRKISDTMDQLYFLTKALHGKK